MKKQVLIKINITNLDIDAILKEYPTIRIYLSNFTRTADRGFISNAEMNDGTLIGDTIDLRNALLDWSFNEAGCYSGNDDKNGNPIYEDGDATKFFEKYPEGFKFVYHKLYEL